MKEYEIAKLVASLSYLGIFLWFLIFDQLTPIPEEVALITIGYLSNHTDINPFLSCFAAIVGLLSIDNLYFYLTSKGNAFIHKMISKIKPGLIQKIKINIQSKKYRTLFIIALIPKIRFLTPILACMFHVSWKDFFIVNTFATIFYVSLYLSLGYLFYNQLDNLLNQVKIFQHLIFIITMIGVGIYILIRYTKVAKK